MPILPLTAISKLYDAQSLAMIDECEILTYTSVRDAYGQITGGGVTGTVTSACGIQMTGGTMKVNGVRQSVEYDAVVRLPLSASVTMTNRIRLTRKANVALNILCDVYATPKQTSTAFKAQVKRVTP